jgi:hypothetical protein
MPRRETFMVKVGVDHDKSRGWEDIRRCFNLFLSVYSTLASRRSKKTALESGAIDSCPAHSRSMSSVNITVLPEPVGEERTTACGRPRSISQRADSISSVSRRTTSSESPGSIRMVWLHVDLEVVQIGLVQLDAPHSCRFCFHLLECLDGVGDKKNVCNIGTLRELA